MKFENVLLVSDIDGTFKGAHRQKVPENYEAVRYFTKNGGKFAFASGRVEYSLSRILPEAEDLSNAPCVFSNGAYLYDYRTGERIHQKTLPLKKYIPLFLEIAQKYGPLGLGIRMNCGDGYITPEVNAAVERDLQNCMDLVKIIPLHELYDVSIDKLVFSGKNEMLREVRARVAEEFPEDFAVSMSCPVLLEYLNPEATKGRQAKYLRDTFYPERTLFAIGDYENDTDLLKSADFSACPADGMEAIKKICDFIVCPSDEGSVADLIRKIEKM